MKIFIAAFKCFFVLFFWGFLIVNSVKAQICVSTSLSDLPLLPQSNASIWEASNKPSTTYWLLTYSATGNGWNIRCKTYDTQKKCEAEGKKLGHDQWWCDSSKEDCDGKK